MSSRRSLNPSPVCGTVVLQHRSSLVQLVGWRLSSSKRSPMTMKLSRLRSPLAAMYTLLHAFVLRLVRLSVHLSLYVDSILQVATGCLPFSHRSNDTAVIFDIMRGVKPSRGCTQMKLWLPEKEVDHFRKLLDRCWSPAPFLRPTMTQIKQELAAISGCCM
jgi:hypothetical protein